MDPPPAPLQSNDDDPALAAPEPDLPLINDDLTEPSPVVPSPPPKPCPVVPFPPLKQVIDIIEPEEDEELIFRSIAYSMPPHNFTDYDSSFRVAALQQQKKKRRHFFSRIGQKSSSNNDVDLKGHVMVKVRTTPVDIIKLENNNTRIIPEEEAVCRFCFHLLFPVNNDHHHHNNNNNNVMMVKCKCKLSLTHELCATEWYEWYHGKEGNNNNNKCDVCDEDVHYIPVTLSRPTDDSSSITPKPDKGSTLKYLWSCYSTPAD